LAPGNDPDAVAGKYGAKNLGPIGNLANTFLFWRPDGTVPESGPDPMASDPGVLWLEQQVLKKQYTRPPQ
jgi:hypothetical protein